MEKIGGKMMRNAITVMLGLLLLSSLAILVSAETDETNDVWHQVWTESGYQWDAYSGSKPNIDITDVSYSIDGSTATVTMTTKGDMSPNTENVVYTIHLQSTESTYYWIFYSNGQGTIMGMGNFQGFTSQFENPISGNTFSISFEIDDPNIDYTIVGFNAEHSDIDAEHGEAWWDYAPNSEAPYYGLSGDENGNGDSGDTGDSGDNGDTDDGNQNTNTPPPSGTPGFEIVFLLIAIGIVYIFSRRKK